MRLEDIGFYTLSDYRAASASQESHLQRCEIVLTDRCNFNCPYCRGMRGDCKGDLTAKQARHTLELWVKDGLQSVRFSGGEPTLYPMLQLLVDYCRINSVKNIAVSTNGSASRRAYEHLVMSGANDFSISLDACCAEDGTIMMGVSNSNLWGRVVDNIRYLSRIAYVTVGVVLTEQNKSQVVDIIKFAHGLGVADIRIIPAAQHSNMLSLGELPNKILQAHPILRYRANNLLAGRPVRGLSEDDNPHCPLVLDDMAVAGQWHFPCIIYLREGGNPIGKVGPDMRMQRASWSKTNRLADPICRSNCLDICRDYNQRWAELHV